MWSADHTAPDEAQLCPIFSSFSPPSSPPPCQGPPGEPGKPGAPGKPGTPGADVSSGCWGREARPSVYGGGCVCVCTRARARALVFGEIESFAGWGSNTGKVSPAEDCRELASLSGSRRPAGERDWDPARDPGEWRPWGRGDAGPLAVDTWSVVSRRRLEGHASFQALRPALSFTAGSGEVAGVALLQRTRDPPSAPPLL